MTAPSRTEQPTLHDVLGAPLPPAPAYGSNSIADVLESASSLWLSEAWRAPRTPWILTRRSTLLPTR